MSDNQTKPTGTPRPTLRQPTLTGYALALLIGCCLCASLVASLF